MHFSIKKCGKLEKLGLESIFQVFRVKNNSCLFGEQEGRNLTARGKTEIFRPTRFELRTASPFIWAPRRLEVLAL
jgi:hypothetical protein